MHFSKFYISVKFYLLKMEQQKENANHKDTIGHISNAVHENNDVDGEHKKYSSQKVAWLFGILSFMLAIALIYSVSTNGFSGGKNIISQEDAKEKTIGYVNNLLQGQATATITSIKDNGDLYEVKLNIGGKPYDSYVTKDGSLLFLNAYDMKKNISNNKQVHEIKKTGKPLVQMFVMSECPYGVMSEEAFFPVAKLLKGKFDFELHFIANDNGDGTFQSLHGQKEVDEDIRQVCVMNYYPENYIDYIDCQNKNYLDKKEMSSTWGECLVKAGFDSKKIKKCAENDEGKRLLIKNIKLSNDLQIGGSPTILMNEGTYNSERTSQSFQQALCNAFNNPPEECSKEITTASVAASPTGGCGQ